MHKTSFEIKYMCSKNMDGDFEICNSFIQFIYYTCVLSTSIWIENLPCNIHLFCVLSNIGRGCGIIHSPPKLCNNKRLNFSQLKKAKYLSKWLKTSSSDQIWSSVYLTVSNKCCNFPGFMDSFWDQLWKEKLRWEQERMKRNPWLWPKQYKIKYKILQTLQRL